ncbi:hypothetical protein [Candidatus Poriferisocius sp.]|uniref:hypothetical protein n=1 Tax=Candidatus Poriferisocius sp. TaxID=3101276 RepID=UPI003B51CB3A
MAVSSYALEYSVSHAEASRRLGRIGAIQEILASIRGFETARVAGWGIDHRGGFGGWVLLTGDQPAGNEAAAVADAHGDVEIRTGAQHSYAELQAAQRGLSEELFAAQHPSVGSGALGSTGAVGQAGPGAPGDIEGAGVGSGVAEVVTFLETDMAGNAVRVGIDPGLASDVGPLGTVSELGFEQSASVVAELLQDHIEVAFTVADGRDIAPAANFQGGDKVSGIVNCTSGFTARRSNGGGYDYGIITAGHCGNDLPTETVPFSMNGVELPFVYGWLSATADAQFHSIPTPASGSHYVLDDFLCRDPASYPTPSCDVTRTEARANMQDDFVCHTGKNSKTSCGRVTSINHMLKWANAPCRNSAGAIVVCDSVFVKVEGQFLRGCRGDSGGPFYRGGTAYGIMAGTSDRNNCTSGGKTVTFSAIGEVEAFLGVDVLTEPVTLTAS